MRPIGKAGMSLVETLFCIGIFILIMGACVGLLLRGWDSWQSSSAQVQLAQGLYRSVARMTNDIRQGGASVLANVPADNNPYPQISLPTAQNVSGGNVVWGPLINYSLGGPGGKQLIRTQNSRISVIAVNITSLQFFRHASTPNVVNVQLTASVPTYRGDQQLTSTLSFDVLMRNS
ncbi:MAG: PilW family protein [Ginsengibacter sp.]